MERATIPIIMNAMLLRPMFLRFKEEVTKNFRQAYVQKRDKIKQLQFI